MRETRVAVVTGSSAGIGEAVARRFAARGMRVVVNSARSVAAGEAVAASLPGAVYVQADVSVDEDAQRLVAAVVERFGRIDVLVNNAGVTRAVPHHDLAGASPKVWREVFDVNVVGTWQVSVAAMPHLTASGDGVVVNVSSIAGSRPAGSSIPYAVSKAAVEHMTRLLARVVGPEVRVNAVAPGFTDTSWTRGLPEFAAIGRRVRQEAPLRRIATPGDVACAVSALVDATYTTGTVLLVDGGAHLVS